MSLSRTSRLRRVVILCESFARNLAYYRTGHNAGKHLFAEAHPHAGFWRQLNSNAIDMLVLEWCKLFTDKDGKGEHGWRTVVTDSAAFHAALLQRLNVTADAFAANAKAIKTYRNNFVAHLGTLQIMDIPTLDMAYEAVRFYHEHVVTKEAKPEHLRGRCDTPENFSKGYRACIDEAEAIFKAAS
jgi:hypothetical protein